MYQFYTMWVWQRTGKIASIPQHHKEPQFHSALRIKDLAHNRHRLKAITLQGAVIFRKCTLMTLLVCSKESVSLGNDVALSVRWEQTNEFAVNRCSRWTCPNSAVTCFRVQLPPPPLGCTHALTHTPTRLWKITCYNLHSLLSYFVWFGALVENESSGAIIDPDVGDGGPWNIATWPNIDKAGRTRRFSSWKLLVSFICKRRNIFQKHK
jgi:hypothetical protein